MNGETWNPDPDVLRFFTGHESAYPLYEAFEEALFARFPGAGKRVRKTQITFFGRRVFACISLMRVKRKAELPDPWIVVTLGLPYPLESGRAAVKTEAYPGRWTTHIVVGSPCEIDDELMDLTEEAWVFAERG